MRILQQPLRADLSSAAGQIAAGGAPLAAAATCFHLHRSYDKNVQTQKWWGVGGWGWGS